MLVLPKLNYKEITSKIIRFLNEEFRKRKKTKAILGISGGLDSSVVAFLCKKAKLDLFALILPYRKQNIDDSLKIARFLNLPKNRVIIYDIGPVVDSQVKDFSKWIKLDKIDKGNIMARQRMIVQYAFARRLNGLVVGTEDLSEYYLGYFTLHGDQACDISPISGLFKTQVKELARYLKMPNWLLEKKPSPGLWEGQTAENELGFSYEEADPILYLRCLKKYSKERIIKKGFNQKLVNKVLERVRATDYKRESPPKILFNK
jgi:NAD+ synthase